MSWVSRRASWKRFIRLAVKVEERKKLGKWASGERNKWSSLWSQEKKMIWAKRMNYVGAWKGGQWAGIKYGIQGSHRRLWSRGGARALTPVFSSRCSILVGPGTLWQGDYLKVTVLYLFSSFLDSSFFPLFSSPPFLFFFLFLSLKFLLLPTYCVSCPLSSHIFYLHYLMHLSWGDLVFRKQRNMSI
jgi:hypothetical protein